MTQTSYLDLGVDAAYRAKYACYDDSYRRPNLAEWAVAATLRVRPQI